MSSDTKDPKFSRRQMIQAGGIALIGAWQQNRIPPATPEPLPPSSAGVSRSPFLPPSDSLDPAVHSRAEILFWTQTMMEHARFFAMLMPGTALGEYRVQAETFQRTFQNHFERSRTATIDGSNYAALSRATAELIKPFMEYKRGLLAAQDSGKIRTMVFSSFFDHTAREAEYGASRLEKIAAGDVSLNYPAVLDFWSGIMSDHTEFIAHLLDPQEQELIGQALDSSAVFQGLKQGNTKRGIRGGDALLAAEDLIEFETTVQDGINANTVKSIIDPALADHLRRETLKFVDELKRSANKT